MRRLVIFSVVLAAVAFPFLALAQTAPVGASVVGTILLHIIEDPTFDGILFAVILVLLKQHLSAKNLARLAAVQKAVSSAFNIVEDMKAQGTLPAGAAKAEVALAQMTKILDAQNVTATDAEVLLAKAAWSAAHGAQTAPVGVVTAVPPPSPAP